MDEPDWALVLDVLHDSRYAEFAVVEIRVTVAVVEIRVTVAVVEIRVTVADDPGGRPALHVSPAAGRRGAVPSRSRRR
ncbi:hypothetical protein ACLQ24_03660 [Micromonospora sp. DT4]|uniref:hypothetical protein n=1 Tax=Micromonospora sp. DT4 TaxID=3393438 RepID=UPI003CF5F792